MYISFNIIKQPKIDEKKQDMLKKSKITYYDVIRYISFDKNAQVTLISPNSHEKQVLQWPLKISS